MNSKFSSHLIFVHYYLNLLAFGTFFPHKLHKKGKFCKKDCKGFVLPINIEMTYRLPSTVCPEGQWKYAESNIYFIDRPNL